LQIRNVKPEDWEGIYAIHCDSSFFKNTGYISPPSKEEVRERWIARPSDPFILTLVAEVDGAIVGYSRLKRGTGISSHTAEIFIIAVRPDWQGRGIGTELMERMLDAADNSLRL
jgi:ribosomal protein S18 acetylase RimI-like enzyme